MSNWTQPGYDPSQHGWHQGEIDGANRGGYAQNYYFANTLYAINAAVGNFFNSIHLYHYTKEGEPTKEIEIALKYGPRTKAFDFRVDQKTGKKYYIQLPNLTYRQTGASWQGDRNSGSREIRTFYSDYFNVNGIDYKMQDKFWSDIQPVPWDITYELVGHFEYAYDADQFCEQLFARFNPECYLNIREFWFVNMRRSLKMKLDSFNREENSDFGEGEKRTTTVTFTFTVEAYFYKPISHGAIIDQIVTTLKTAPNANHEWQLNMKGNYDGSLNNRYDFSKIYNTKIGHVYEIKPESTIPVWDSSTSAWHAKYEYDETSELTNYPWNSKQLWGAYGTIDSNHEIFNKCVITPHSTTSAINPVHYDAYPSACSGYFVNMSPDFSGNNFTYDVALSDKGQDGTSMTTIRAWKDMDGYGDFGFDAVRHIGYKTVDLGTTVVENAPWISSAGIVHED